MRRIMYQLAVMLLMSLLLVAKAHACTTCGCTVGMLGKDNHVVTNNTDHKWFFRYIYDQVVWQDKPAAEIHSLHHNDHEVHNKTTEITHHYQIGNQITDDLKVLVDIPYLEKNSIEIHDHSDLGVGQHARGLGDLQLLGEYRLWHQNGHALGLAGGFRFPTGNTREKNFQAERFETESQPGSGAYNYILGGFYKWQAGPMALTANASYVITQKGAQDFKYGELFTTSIEAGYTINPNSKYFQTSLGLNSIYQNEAKEESNGIKNRDSGGQTVLVGPILKMNANENLSFSGTIVYPVSQRLNGFTQKQDFNWIMSTQLKF